MKKAAAILLIGFVILTGAIMVSLLHATHSAGENTYELALITDDGQVDDNGFNSSAYEAMKTYAEANNKTYNYYDSEATDKDRTAAMRQAVKYGAKLIIAPGSRQANAVKTAALKNPDVKFIFVDGFVLTDNNNKPLPNVTAVAYKEQEAGFLAGYAAVQDGYTKLGGTFGGGGADPACGRFAYGYVQGAQAASEERNVKVEIKISFRHGKSFTPSHELTDQMKQWYEDGTEVIFACGGLMIESVIAAARETDNGAVIGVDTDQSALSDRIITSAMKEINLSVLKILDAYRANKWDKKLAGRTIVLGAADGAVSLPMLNSKFSKFTQEQYDAVYAKIRDGSIVPKADVTGCDKAAFWAEAVKGSRVTLIYE